VVHAVSKLQRHHQLSVLVERVASLSVLIQLEKHVVLLEHAMHLACKHVQLKSPAPVDKCKEGDQWEVGRFRADDRQMVEYLVPDQLGALQLVVAICQRQLLLEHSCLQPLLEPCCLALQLSW
jgi:hypothetical protein